MNEDPTLYEVRVGTPEGEVPLGIIAEHQVSQLPAELDLKLVDAGSAMPLSDTEVISVDSLPEAAPQAY